MFRLSFLLVVIGFVSCATDCELITNCTLCAWNESCFWCPSYTPPGNETEEPNCFNKDGIGEIAEYCSEFCSGDNCEYVCAPPEPYKPPANVSYQCTGTWLYPCAGAIGADFLLMIMYGAILAIAAKWISDGSEMLLVIFPPGIVGGFVLPVLGAVPDAAIIVFSGIGSKEEAQEQVAVGMGTLAGSTIMLLTIPFSLSIYLGKCDINDKGVQIDKTDTRWCNPCYSGVTFDSDVPINAGISMCTSLSYFLVQGIAFYYLFKYEIHQIDDTDIIDVTLEKWFAFGGMFVCFLLFILYSFFTVLNTGSQKKRTKLAKEMHRHKVVADRFKGMASIYQAIMDKEEEEERKRDELLKKLDLTTMSDEEKVLVNTQYILDQAKKWGRIWKEKAMMDPEVHEVVIESPMDQVDAMDPVEGAHEPPVYQEGVDKVDEDEVDETQAIIVGEGEDGYGTEGEKGKKKKEEEGEKKKKEEGDDDDEEEYADWPKWKILVVACFWMVLGACLVTFFSDPMVGVISDTANMIHIDTFFVSFVITPLCSNASELIASMFQAMKKKRENNTVSFAQLYGASIMNNTLCLGIFFMLVFIQELEWVFSAETLTIFLSTLFMGCIGLSTCFTQYTLRLWCCCLIIMVYPISLLFVWFLEDVCHWK